MQTRALAQTREPGRTHIRTRTRARTQSGPCGQVQWCARARQRWALRGDDGGAIVEFLGISVLVLIPLVYVVVTLAQLQAGIFAAEGAARTAARGAVTAGVQAERAGDADALEAASQRAWQVVSLAGEDAGIADPSVDVACEGACLAPGSSVAVDVTMPVRLPGVPDLVAEVIPLTIVVTANASAPVPGEAS